jgi:2,3-bisphosphoglycerate-dependent phosphoglycerate mutase
MLPSSTTPLSHRLVTADLWLVRHGESTWNTLGLIQGHRDDAELTARGAEQAAAAAELFRCLAVSAVYSSDLRRALQTAAAFSEVLGVPVTRDMRLRERSLGVLEGAPQAAATTARTGLGDGLVVDPDASPDGGESVRDLYRRAAAFCDDLARGNAGNAGNTGSAGSAGNTGSAGDGGDVVIVAHGGTLRVLRAYLTGVPVERMSWEPLENASVLRIGARDVSNTPRGGTE